MALGRVRSKALLECDMCESLICTQFATTITAWMRPMTTSLLTFGCRSCGKRSPWISHATRHYIWRTCCRTTITILHSAQTSPWLSAFYIAFGELQGHRKGDSVCVVRLHEHPTPEHVRSTILSILVLVPHVRT
eukprot:3905300-Amphidinium_carterae.1